MATYAGYIYGFAICRCTAVKQSVPYTMSINSRAPYPVIAANNGTDNTLYAIAATISPVRTAINPRVSPQPIQRTPNTLRNRHSGMCHMTVTA